MTGVERAVVGATPDGEPVERVVLGEAPGPVVHLLSLGACVDRFVVTGGDGVRRDVVLGHDTLADRLAGTGFHGAVVGRYANRIAHGDLPLPGGAVRLPTNDRGHHLHGGPDGYHLRAWRLAAADDERVRLELDSPDGDQGYPGALQVVATYRLEGDTLRLDLEATTDRTTVVNLSHHAYWNLGGVGSGTVDDHTLEVPADRWAPVDPTGIPLGALADVAGTPFDLRTARRLGDVVRDPHPQVVAGPGLDHDLVLGEHDGTLRTVAVLTSPATRTRLTLRSDRPGLQVYTGNMLDGTETGRGGVPHRQGDGVALEPQLHPDSPHHPDWPSATLAAGETSRATVSWTVGPS